MHTLLNSARTLVLTDNTNDQSINDNDTISDDERREREQQEQ